MDSDDRAAIAAELADGLRRALEVGELVVYYQPEYDVGTGRVVAVEALCRWCHPQHGLLLPVQFIEVAEAHGLMARISDFVLEESGRRIGEWHRQGAEIGVSINVSPSQLDPAFAEGVLRHVTELGLPQGVLTVEITESPEISFSEPELSALASLIDGGVGVSLDDFGTGHTTLELVERLPITEVKIDRSLVQDDSDETDAVVRDCIRVAHGRGATVVAEGIENQEHFARAVAWGVDRAQGYFFAPPLPADELTPLLVGAL
ncbi:MAG: EAL domain-containing protein [Pseudolysinimonas sp.]|uniref:EAL domain-containing protein n=1 Tax=Pseudolysinimonas sp. TaxID=2680009 RepID=UPI003263A1A6